MTRVLVLYYSAYGHVYEMAHHAVEGAKSVSNIDVDLMKVPDLTAHTPNNHLDQSHIQEATVNDLPNYDAILLGTPTRFGNMAGQMKLFLDQAGSLWANNSLVGKVGGVFTSTGSQHGGHEASVLSTHIPLLHLGMIISGLPYTFTDQLRMDEIVGGSPYGAGTIAGGDGSRKPSQSDLAGAYYQGQHIATLAKKISKHEER